MGEVNNKKKELKAIIKKKSYKHAFLVIGFCLLIVVQPVDKPGENAIFT